MFADWATFSLALIAITFLAAVVSVAPFGRYTGTTTANDAATIIKGTAIVLGVIIFMMFGMYGHYMGGLSYEPVSMLIIRLTSVVVVIWFWVWLGRRMKRYMLNPPPTHPAHRAMQPRD